MSATSRFPAAEPVSLSLDPYFERLRTSRGPAPRGHVHELVGTLVEVVGIRAPVGAELGVRIGERELLLEVIGFRKDRLLTAPLGSTTGVEPGAEVYLRPYADLAPVGDALLGRIVDAFGKPLDGSPLPRLDGRSNLHAQAPDPYARRPIHLPIDTKVRVLDALLPLGRGQRVGLFAGTGVGKSTLLGMLCRHAAVDVIVVGLIGERGREVGDFVRNALGTEGLARSVVVAATSDVPPYVRARGALRATAIAEYFRDQGKHVLLVMDSVTRYAMALREASLAAGEPPLTKGYTPSVFGALPKLLERAGNGSGEGSITAVYTVLVEGDDLNDPIADAVRGILDGHIVLSRHLADRGVFPAVDVLKSVSRLATEIAPVEQQHAAACIRGALATYADASDLIQIGAYVKGTDPAIDRAEQAHPLIERFIRQGLREATPREQAIQTIMQMASDMS